MFKLAWRNILEHKTRSLLTTLGIILGVSLVLAVCILTQSTIKSVQMMFTEGSDKIDVTLNTDKMFSANDIERIKKVEGVKTVMAMSEDISWLDDADGALCMVRIKGVDIKKDREFRDYYITKGTWFTGREERELIISEVTAAKLGLKCNDTVNVLTNSGEQKYNVTGIIAGRGAGNQSDYTDLYAPSEILTKDFGHPGKYQRLDLVLESRDMIEDVLGKINEDFGDQKIYSRTITDKLSLAEEKMNGTFVGFYTILVVVIFVGFFLVYNTFMVILAERLQLIGILRTIGMDKKQTLRMFTAEGIILGIFGTTIGLVLGLGVGLGLLAAMSKSANLNISSFVVSPLSILAAIATGLLIPVISCIRPANLACKYRPIEALKEMESNPAYTKRKGFLQKYQIIIGILFIIAFIVYYSIYADIIKGGAIDYFSVPVSLILSFIGVVLLIPFILEKLVTLIDYIAKRILKGKTVVSVRNLLRKGNRTSTTISMIVMGIAVVICFNGMFSSAISSMLANVEKEMKGDIFISANPSWDLNSTQYLKKYEDLKQIKEVENIYYTRVFWGEDSDGYAQQIIGIKADEHKKMSYFNLVKGNLNEIYDKLSRKENVAVIGRVQSKILGYKIGDVIKLKGKDKEYPFTIIGIVSNDDSEVYINRDLMDEMYGNRLADKLTIKTKEGADLKALKKSVSKIVLTQYIVTIYEMREQTKAAITQGAQPMSVVNIITLLVALFGLMNVLLMSVMGRKREIGNLRSIGASKKQIRGMVLAESVIMGIFSIVIGSLTGIMMEKGATAVMQTLNHTQVKLHIPFGFLGLVNLIIILCALVAAMYPAYIATKLGIVEAIKGE